MAFEAFYRVGYHGTIRRLFRIFLGRPSPGSRELMLIANTARGVRGKGAVCTGVGPRALSWIASAVVSPGY